VVDDDLVNQRVLANLLKRKGWESDVARSGRECLEKLAASQFDLILLDIQMPEMDGFRTAELVRQQEPAQTCRPRTPIVALTALRQPDTRERCLAAGMDDHLTKPVDTAQLYTAIERALGLPG
jgi:two-component system, sensor histidine kinase and response regulator